MSSGHSHHFTASEALAKELKKLLDDPKAKAYLSRKYTVEERPMPLTGGSSLDGRTYYLDPSLAKPVKIGTRTVDLRPFVLSHERTEKVLRDLFGMSYNRAHELATMAEHQKVTAAGISWNLYKRTVAKPVRQDEKERVTLPKNFDMGPLRSS